VLPLPSTAGGADERRPEDDAVFGNRESEFVELIIVTSSPLLSLALVLLLLLLLLLLLGTTQLSVVSMISSLCSGCALLWSNPSLVAVLSCDECNNDDGEGLLATGLDTRFTVSIVTESAGGGGVAALAAAG
jgi:hypothetical protein